MNEKYKDISQLEGADFELALEAIQNGKLCPENDRGCGEWLPLDAFYSYPNYRHDGSQGSNTSKRCKTCTSKMNAAHGQTKRRKKPCLSCGKSDPEVEFGFYMRSRKGKATRPEFYSRCLECKKLYDQTYDKDVRGVPKEIKEIAPEKPRTWEKNHISHTGPVKGTVEYLFFCKLPFPPLSKELRETRPYIGVL